MRTVCTRQWICSIQCNCQNAHAWICSGGKIYLEIGDGMGARVRDIFARNGWAFDRAETDLSGIERVLVFGAQV